MMLTSKKAKEITSKGFTLEENLGTARENEVNIAPGCSKIYNKNELNDAVIQIKCKFAYLF